MRRGADGAEQRLMMLVQLLLNGPSFPTDKTVVVTHALLHELQLDAHAGQRLQHILQRAARPAGQRHQPRHIGPLTVLISQHK